VSSLNAKLTDSMQEKQKTDAGFAVLQSQAEMEEQ
jgi:hypothetical protein